MKRKLPKTCSVNMCLKYAIRGVMCRRHSEQMYRLGKIVKTDREGNYIELCDDCALIHIEDEDGDLRSKVIIDKEDAYRCSLHRWSQAQGRSDYIYTLIDRKYMPLHKFVLNCYGGGREIQVDHKNMDKLDNRKNNLRLCNTHQNKGNQPKQMNNTSGYKGVFLRKDSDKYRAAIRVNQKLIHLGQFDNPIEAAKCYNRAALEYFGEFARLNLIEEI